MITLFGTTCRDFAEAPLSKAQLIADANFRSLARLGTLGGTEMGPALRHVMDSAAAHSPQRHKHLFLITDAQVGNETAILKIASAMPDFRVHCFGIDTALNDSLLIALTRQQGGTFHSLTPNDDIRAAVTALGRTLRLPVLLDLAVPPGWELAGAKIPDLYAGQIRYFSARTTGSTSLELQARTPEGRPVTIAFAFQPASVKAAYWQWCKERIARHLDAGERPQAIALSIASNLICPLTAFIAWDGLEKVAVAEQELVQPVMERHGLYESRQCFLQSSEPVSPPRSLHFTSGLSEPSALEISVFRRRQFHSKLRRKLLAIALPGGDEQRKQLCTDILAWIAQADGEQVAARVSAVEELIARLQTYSFELHRRALEAKLQSAGLEMACGRFAALLRDLQTNLQIPQIPPVAKWQTSLESTAVRSGQDQLLANLAFIAGLQEKISAALKEFCSSFTTPKA